MKMSMTDALAVQLGLTAMGLKKIMSKRTGYSGKVDPYANLRTSDAVEVEPWRGVMVRCMDKISRRKQFNMTGGVGMDLSDEKWADPHFDHINYIAIEGGLSIETLAETNEPMAEALLGLMYSEAKDLIPIILELGEGIIDTDEGG